MSLRIDVASKAVHPRGGIERVALETIAALAARGHSVRLFAYDADQGRLPAGVRMHPVDRPRGGRLRASLAFPRLAEAAMATEGGRREVTLGFGSLSVPGSVVWVTSVHQRWMEVAASGEVAASWRRRINPFHPLIARQERRQYAPHYHARLLAMGPAITSDLVRFCGTRVADVMQLPHGFDPVKFSAQRASELRGPMREQLGYDADDRVVLMVANEIPRKGVDTAVCALGQIDDPRTKLLLVGRLDSDAVAVLAASAGLAASRVRVCPPADDVAAFYSASDVVALPTVYDAWGLVIVEALACGRPVVTTSRAGAATLINPDCGSVLGNPKDVPKLVEQLMAWTTRDNAAIAAGERAAVKAVSELTWGAVIKDYEAVLYEVARDASA